MAGSENDFPEYATKHSKEALAARKALPVELQSLSLDIVDQLAQDPNRKPHHNRPLSRDGSVFLYTHPQPALEITYEVDQEHKVLYFLHFAAPMLHLAKPLFISYSHDDADWLKKLKTWLKPLEQKDLIKIWDDTEIGPGALWEEEIERSLNAARAALLLVSQNFLASEFIGKEELPKLLLAAKDKGVLILWVAVSDSTYEDTDLNRYQALNNPKEPLDSLEPPMQNKELRRIYEKVKEAIQG